MMDQAAQMAATMKALMETNKQLIETLKQLIKDRENK